MTGWLVILEVRDPKGVPYNYLYRGISTSSAYGAIDYALERYAGSTGGERNLAPGWRVVRALAIEGALLEEAEIEPITGPVYRRRTFP
jgi:hypothetical protein